MEPLSAERLYDTKGEIRWYMEPSKIYDPNNIYMAGIMMGFRQNNDGAFTWGYGQRYVKYDLMDVKSSTVSCPTAMPTSRTPWIRCRTAITSCALPLPTMLVPTASMSARFAT